MKVIDKIIEAIRQQKRRGEQPSFLRAAEEIKRFSKDEKGSETIEYALVAACIVLSTAAGVMTLALWLLERYQAVNTTLP